MGKYAGIGCLSFVVIWVAMISIESCAKSHGWAEIAPHKAFLILDEMPHNDPACHETVRRVETLAHTARRLGWPTPGGMDGENHSGYNTIRTPAPYPCELRQRWVRHPWPTNTALEILKSDAISVTVSNPEAGKPRRLWVNYHKNGPSYDGKSHNDEASLLNHHFAAVAWNPALKEPACLVPWSFFNAIDWPPRTTAWLYILFFVGAILQVFACIAKERYYPLLWIPLYALFLSFAASGVSAYQESRATCEPQANVFAARYVKDGVLQQFPADALNGPWIVGNAVVIWSQTWFYLVLFGLLRLIYPAVKGAHYLFVPHPAAAYIQTSWGRPPEVNVKGFAAALGRVNPNAPEFVLRNMERHMQNLVDRIRRHTPRPTGGE